MKNLFDYATKELSQDAFLMWLFNNYDCENEDISKASKDLIYKLTKIDPDSITEVWTKAQWGKIDITVLFRRNNGKRAALFIEDKVDSYEHNQLISYNQQIERIMNLKDNKGNFDLIKKIYYKPQVIKEDEELRIKEADWEIFSFEDIKDFWSHYTQASSEILSQYALHILKVWDSAVNVTKPIENDQYAWISYFEKIIKPNLDKKYNNLIVDIFPTRFKYSVLKIKPSSLPSDIPYLEVRSRDCCDNKFLAKILMYDVPCDSNGQPIRLLDMHNVIKELTALEDSVFKGQYSFKKNKQVAHSLRDGSNSNVIADNEFLDRLYKSIDEYLVIVNKWFESNNQ